MILPYALRNFAVLATALLPLLLLPVSGLCQGQPAQAKEPPMLMEEVIVIGNKPLLQLKLELHKAEVVLYDLFNTFNTDDNFDVQCTREAVVGTRIKERVCRTKFQRELIAKASQRMMQGEAWVSPAGEIKRMNELLLKNMTETALEQPEMMEALVRATKIKQLLESERKRRCEGKLFFCW